MRLPEPRGRQLLRPLRREAPGRGGGAGHDDDVLARGVRGRTARTLLEELATEGPALVVRSGGGRAGEHFLPEGERTTIGRSPDNEIFLDDVTVSRKHAVLIRRGDEFFIEDLGSLNGTYVNRKRIESARLESGDEVQVGKYRLTFMTK